MKIGIYKDTFANNRGADIAVKNLAAGLSERGHEVTLFDKSEFEAKVRGEYALFACCRRRARQCRYGEGQLAPLVE